MPTESKRISGNVSKSFWRKKPKKHQYAWERYKNLLKNKKNKLLCKAKKWGSRFLAIKPDENAAVLGKRR